MSSARMPCRPQLVAHVWRISCGVYFATMRPSASGSRSPAFVSSFTNSRAYVSDRIGRPDCVVKIRSCSPAHRSPAYKLTIITTERTDHAQDTFA
jgi:hypothetical protein